MEAQLGDVDLVLVLRVDVHRVEVEWARADRRAAVDEGCEGWALLAGPVLAGRVGVPLGPAPDPTSPWAAAVAAAVAVADGAAASVAPPVQ